MIITILSSWLTPSDGGWFLGRPRFVLGFVRGGSGGGALEAGRPARSGGSSSRARIKSEIMKTTELLGHNNTCPTHANNNLVPASHNSPLLRIPNMKFGISDSWHQKGSARISQNKNLAYKKLTQYIFVLHYIRFNFTFLLLNLNLLKLQYSEHLTNHSEILSDEIQTISNKDLQLRNQVWGSLYNT